VDSLATKVDDKDVILLADGDMVTSPEEFVGVDVGDKVGAHEEL